MKNSITLVILALSFVSFGQKENRTHCAKRDAFGLSNMKSNSLSLTQIQETNKYDVNYYALDVAMDNLSTDIGGTGEIHGTANVALDSVLFELFQTFTISEIRLNGVATNYSRVGSAIKVPVNLPQGGSFAIAIDYDGTPPTAATNPLGGAGMTNSSSPTWGNQVTWSLSEPFSAYEWWPCKQSLIDKADSCSVKITVPDNLMAGSQGVLENTVDLGNGFKRFEWKHNHPIDYYLVSVAVAEYVEYNVYANPTGSVGPVLIQNFVYNNPATLPNFQNDIDETVDFMELFADLFGPYPYQDEKYGHCMAPLSGGMEHQTMTTQGWFEKGLTAHELGHQWWGNNITCGSWADIWVNEGFASYCEYLILEDLYPNETGAHMNGVHNNVMSQNGGSTYCLDSLNENRIFSGRLSYDKGSAIIHTFRYIINNDSLFFAALRDIQNNYAEGTAIGLDIRDELQSFTGVDLTDAFDEWYFGQGFPTYSARWNTVGNDLLLEITHTTSSNTPTFTNPVDVRFTRFLAPDTTIRLDIQANYMAYVIPGMGNAAQLTNIDRDNWIINDIGNITKDANLTAFVDELIPEYFNIYPNPSNGEFNIEISNNNDHELIVRDTKARIVHQSTLNGQSTFDLSDLDSGYYVVTLTNSNGEQRIKTIVKK
jgi:aminopeptidase N